MKNKKILFIIIIGIIIISGGLFIYAFSNQNNEPKENNDLEQIDLNEIDPQINDELNEDINSTSINVNDNLDIVEPEPIEPIRYRIITEQPVDDFYVIWFSTVNSTLPVYIVFEEEMKIELTLLLNFELNTAIFSRDSINEIGIPLGYLVVIDNMQCEVWSNGKLVSLDPNKFEYISWDVPEFVELLHEIMIEIGISQFNPDIIQNIVSIEIKNNTGIDGFYDVIITDASKIAEIETILSSAVAMYGTACPFNDVFLTLTPATGYDVIFLAMAGDDCNTFFFNGQYFTFKVPRNGFWYEYFTDHMPTALGDN
jgi:hypothetical protein